MREAEADLWTLHAAGAVVCITTNGLVPAAGPAALGRGAARQAAARFPGLAARLGEALRAAGNHVQLLGERLVAFPVEHHPEELPDLDLIERSARELAALATARGWGEVVLPRPGCGGGGLAWGEVRPRIAPFLDGRFLVVTRPLPARSGGRDGVGSAGPASGAGS